LFTPAATRSASLALEWIPEDGRRSVGRPKKIWQDTLKEDSGMMGVDWSGVRLPLPAIVLYGNNSSPDVPLEKLTRSKTHTVQCVCIKKLHFKMHSNTSQHKRKFSDKLKFRGQPDTPATTLLSYCSGE